MRIDTPKKEGKSDQKIISVSKIQALQKKDPANILEIGGKAMLKK